MYRYLCQWLFPNILALWFFFTLIHSLMLIFSILIVKRWNIDFGLFNCILYALFNFCASLILIFDIWAICMIWSFYILQVMALWRGWFYAPPPVIRFFHFSWNKRTTLITLCPNSICQISKKFPWFWGPKVYIRWPLLCKL